jgi:poly-gamma-glutamate capsule biosynthesis protein CapA/YwtB (metallophosphatase superfamily)
MGNDIATIIFLGDIYLGPDAGINLGCEVLKNLSLADLIVANQEGPICNTENSIKGKCCLKSAPETAAILKKWGVDVVSLANNHMFDYGWEGFKQTRELLGKAEIAYLGAGKGLDEATKPLILEVKGLKIGLLAYSWGFVQTTCATESSFGCAPLDIKLMTEQIGKLKNQVDAVIVMPHWGYCEYLFPTPEQVEMGKLLVKAGATAVIGHHSHVIQGLTKEGNSLIAYSLGNFAFAGFKDRGRPAKLTKDNMRGVILKVKFANGETISHDIIFTRQKGNTVELDRSSECSKDFNCRSEVLYSENYGDYWQCYTRKRLFKRILYWCNVLNWRYMHVETLVGFWLMLKGIFQRHKIGR